MEDNTNFIHYVESSLRQEGDFHFLRFEYLQRLNLVKMQVDLVHLRSRIQKDKNPSEDDFRSLKIMLEDYGKH